MADYIVLSNNHKLCLVVYPLGDCFLRRRIRRIKRHLTDLVATYLGAFAEEGLRASSIVRKRAAVQFFMKI